LAANFAILQKYIWQGGNTLLDTLPAVHFRGLLDHLIHPFAEGEGCSPPLVVIAPGSAQSIQQIATAVRVLQIAHNASVRPPVASDFGALLNIPGLYLLIPF
jgi:hypothetical protein